MSAVPAGQAENRAGGRAGQPQRSVVRPAPNQAAPNRTRRRSAPLRQWRRYLPPMSRFSASCGAGETAARDRRQMRADRRSPLGQLLARAPRHDAASLQACRQHRGLAEYRRHCLHQPPERLAVVEHRLNHRQPALCLMARAELASPEHYQHPRPKLRQAHQFPAHPETSCGGTLRSAQFGPPHQLRHRGQHSVSCRQGTE